MNAPNRRTVLNALFALLTVAATGCPSSRTGPLVTEVREDLQPIPCDGIADCRVHSDSAPNFDRNASDAPTSSIEAVEGEPCAAWSEDLSAANLASLNRFGLSQGLAVVSGSFGEPVELQYDTYAPFSVDTVHYGWSFLAGVEVMIRIHPELVGNLPESDKWTVALSQDHPTPWEQDYRPVWGNALAVVPQAQSADLSEAMGYRTLATTMVAVVRIADQDEYRTTFEVIDALQGTFPATFQDNWYESWGLPYPGVSDAQEETWIVSIHGLNEYPDDVVLGSVYDFRPATPEHLAVVKAELASPYAPYDVLKLRERRDELLTGLLFYHSPAVVSSVVTGLAMECCTGAGGTYVEHEVTEVLRGADIPPRIVIGGHAYYGEEACGDPFLYAFSTVVDPYQYMESPFNCLEYPDMISWDAFGPPIESGFAVRLPTTEGNRASVDAWLASSSPLYQLHPPDASVPVKALDQNPMNSPWSQPRDAVEAFVSATHIALIQIDEVTWNDQIKAHEVIFSTTFSTHEYDHLERYSVKLSFSCGDPRLLEIGSRWIGGLILVDPWMFGIGEGPDLSRGYLIPGALVPESALTDQLGNNLAYFLN